jgi:hypothetical protein
VDPGHESAQTDREPLEHDRQHRADDAEHERRHQDEPLRAVGERGRRQVQAYRKAGRPDEQPEEPPAEQEHGEPDEERDPPAGHCRERTTGVRWPSSRAG